MMNIEDKIFAGKIISFVIGAVIILTLVSYLHEITHQEIFRLYDCDSKVIFLNYDSAREFHWFATEPVGDCEYTENLLLAQSIAEAIGYPMVYLNSAVWVYFLAKVSGLL